ncbi:MAG: hypothetical protein HC854_11790 [Flavobacterium sp.]|nr:hypothetical protein [Flavobacterium sp.]
MNYEMFIITDYINYGGGSLFVSPILFVDFIGFMFVIMFFILNGIKEKKKQVHTSKRYQNKSIRKRIRNYNSKIRK